MGISVKEVQKLARNRSLSNFLLLSVVNILTMAGFYPNYTTAKAAIAQKKVKVNNNVVINSCQTVQPGDLISVSKKVKDKRLITAANSFMQITSDSVFIVKLPDAHALQLLTLQNFESLRRVKAKVKDPLNSVFVRRSA